MKYIESLDSLLRPKDKASYLALDLFAGCGGMALGFEANGFETVGYESDPDCCSTYKSNLMGSCENVYLDKNFQFQNADIVIGGPPCQPFSVGGNQKGVKDKRNGVPVFIEAVRQTKPKLFVFENVRGLLYKNNWYLDTIVKEFMAMGYVVDFRLMNAKHFGVPQNRERLIVVGHNGSYKFPTELTTLVSAGEALGDLACSVPPGSRFLNESMDRYVKKYEDASCCVTPRDLHLNKPSRTITCRNLAGATGDMMRVKLKDGRRRRLVAREAARLQSFPDWFEFIGNETSVFNQIGNAVPPMLSYHIASSVKSYLQLYSSTSPAIVSRRYEQQVAMNI
ncbi:MAG: DNA cytosine methyltransferase [Desulfovibrio sp.]|nr:DNA cytosine methyltransferase [Desulfovibrio sp.]